MDTTGEAIAKLYGMWAAMGPAERAKAIKDVKRRGSPEAVDFMTTVEAKCIRRCRACGQANRVLAAGAKCGSCKTPLGDK